MRRYTDSTAADQSVCCGVQLTTQQVGTIPGPPLPANVTGELDLTQSLAGPLDNGTAATRGFVTEPPGRPFISNATQARTPASEQVSTLIAVPAASCPTTVVHREEQSASIRSH